jgi:hypothetical protein
MATTMQVEILEDGTISVTSGDIEDTKHVSADKLLEELAEMTGGTRTRKPRDHTFWKNKAVRRGGRVVKTGR